MIAGVGIGVAAVTIAAAAVFTPIGPTARREPTSPVAPVDADLSNAPLAKPGKDYTVVASYDVRSLAKRGGRLIESATPGDFLVYRIGHDGSSDATEIGLLNPVNDARMPLPDAIARVGANRIITSKTMIAGASYGKPGAGFWYYDTTDGSWDTLHPGRGRGGRDHRDQPGHGRHLADPVRHRGRASSSTCRSAHRARSSLAIDWCPSPCPTTSTPLTMARSRSGRCRREPRCSSRAERRRAAPLILRDLSSGKESEISVPAGQGTCSIVQLWMRAESISAWEDCRTESGDGYSQFQVLSRAGERQRAVTGTQFEVLTGADRNMLIRSQSPQGLFLYNTDTGKILRLTKGLAPFTDLGASEGNRWVFASPIQGGKGVRITVADLH